MRAHVGGSTLEPLAKAIAVARGLLRDDQPFCTLPIDAQRELREASRMAHAGRPWTDAAQFCRDYYPQTDPQYRKAFNALTPAQQNVVMQRVATIVNGIRLSLSGAAEPLNAYTRAQVQPGATTSDWSAGLVRTAGGWTVQ
jgi:hypothetical protein